ncbi:MAG: restriction endonuclease subunit S, partial [Ktedonobacterales bacterium]
MASSATWPTVALDEVLVPVSRPVRIEPSQIYSLLGMHWYAEGLYVKERKLGAQIQSDTLYEVKDGDFVYNRLFGWKGSFGVATAEVGGCHVSNEFPCFRIDTTRLHSGFLRWYFSQASIWDYVAGQSSGSTPTSRLRLKEPQFLALQIPLPRLDEQRRIVARIEELAARIKEARELRREAMTDIEGLYMSSIERVFRREDYWKELPVSEICEPPQYGYTESATLDRIGPKFLRITDIQNGRVDWESVPYCSCPEPAKYLLLPNDLLFARTGATTGKSFLIETTPGPAVFASYLIRLRVRERVIPEYLYGYFQTPSYWLQIGSGAAGTGQANVNGKKLASIHVPVPPISEQQHIVKYLDAVKTRIETMKQLQATTALEIDSLLPSV